MAAPYDTQMARRPDGLSRPLPCPTRTLSAPGRAGGGCERSPATVTPPSGQVMVTPIRPVGSSMPDWRPRLSEPGVRHAAEAIGPAMVRVGRWVAVETPAVLPPARPVLGQGDRANKTPTNQRHHDQDPGEQPGRRWPPLTLGRRWGAMGVVLLWRHG